MLAGEILINVGANITNFTSNMSKIGSIASKAGKEASDSLGKVSDGAEKSSKSLAGMVRQSVAFTAGQAIYSGAATAVSFLKDQFTDCFTVAEDAQNAIVQTNTVIKSTKDVSGMTSTSVADLAEKLSGMTKFTKDTVMSSEDMLLTFTNIGKNVFPQATQTVLDMSQALGQDTKSSAIQLGKALNDPVKGMTALSRVGVTFSQSQKDTIAAMMKTGNLAGAQGVILKELGTEFGGTAVAAGTTFAGKLQILQNKLTEVKENVGNQLMPYLSKLEDWFMSPAVQAFVTTALNNLIVGLQKTITFLVPIVTNLVQFAQWMIQGSAGARTLGVSLGIVAAILATMKITQVIVSIISLVPVLWTWATASTAVGFGMSLATWQIALIVIGVAALIAVVVLLVTHWTQVVTFLKGVWSACVTWLITSLQNIGLWFKNIWNVIFTFIMVVWSNITNSIKTALTNVGNAIKNGFNAVMTFVKAAGLILFTILFGPYILLYQGIKAVMPTIIAVVTSILNGVKAVLTPFAQFFSSLFTTLWAIAVAIFGKIFSAIMVPVNNILIKMQEVWNAVSGFLTGIWNAISAKAKEIWGGVSTTVGNKASDLGTTLHDRWNEISKTAVDLWTKISGFIVQKFWDLEIGAATALLAFWNNITSKFNAIRDFIASVWNAIYSFMGGIFSSIGSLVNTAFTNVKNTLVNIWNGIKDAVMGVVKDMVNGIIGILNGDIRGINDFMSLIANGVNSVADKLGVDKSMRVSFTPIKPIAAFANGTNYAPGGLSLVGERGAELVQMPRGASVATAAQTAAAMAGQGPSNNSGVGNWLSNIWGMFSSGASGIMSAIMSNIGGPLKGGAGMLGSITGGVGSFIMKMIQDFISKIMPTVTPPSDTGAIYGTGNVAGVQDWLKGVADTKPYVWGGVGPDGYDCSGLAGEVWNRLTGHASYTRRMLAGQSAAYYADNSGASHGGGPLGFAPGKGTFTIAVTPEHMWGSVGGYGFEAANPSMGVLVGSAATSMNTGAAHYFLKALGGSIDGSAYNNPANGAQSGQTGATGSGGTSGSLMNWIDSAIGLTHVPIGWENDLHTIAMFESGGNPNAQNNTDSNARAGHPSQGIMQTIPSTFSAYEVLGHNNIRNPVDNIAAAINYIKSRYGDVSNVPGIKSLLSGGGYVGYANGGVINEKILGVGMSTGTKYAFGENGSETIIPNGKSGGTTGMSNKDIDRIVNAVLANKDVYLDGKKVTDIVAPNILKQVTLHTGKKFA